MVRKAESCGYLKTLRLPFVDYAGDLTTSEGDLAAGDDSHLYVVPARNLQAAQATLESEEESQARATRCRVESRDAARR